MEFENALLAVDPTIEGASCRGECLAVPSVFTDDYFGTDPTEAPYEVTDGKFTNWPIESDLSDFIVDNSSVSVAGQPSASFLRGPEPLPLHQATATGQAGKSRYPTRVPPIGGLIHKKVEGSGMIGMNVLRPKIHHFILVPMPALDPPGGGGGGDGAQERGDFEDPITSPNGAIFMFHHANLDRGRLWWMQHNTDEEEMCGYYGFPVENASLIMSNIQQGRNNFVGAHLNDVLSSSWGFTAPDLGIDICMNSTTDQQLTHADIMC